MNIFKYFKKEKQPEIKFWSTVPGLEEIVPPEPMKNHIPSWFKNMPRDLMPNALLHPGTAKRCPSFVDYFSQGYVISLWCDLAITINKDRSYKVYSPEDAFRFENHGDEQFLDYVPNREHFDFSMILKAHCPWRVITPPGYSMLQLPLFYNFDKTFTVAPGTIWTDIHHEINQQIMFTGYGDFFLPRGTPLAVYIPFKREKYKMEICKNDSTLEHLNSVSYYWWAGRFKDGYREHQNKIKKDEK